MSEEVAVIKFPKLTINVRILKELGNTCPEWVFMAWQDGKIYSTYYQSADEIIEGNSIKDLAQKIQRFLSSDGCVKKTGKPIIKML